jgi:hypothetical protein
VSDTRPVNTPQALSVVRHDRRMLGDMKKNIYWSFLPKPLRWKKDLTKGSTGSQFNPSSTSSDMPGHRKSPSSLSPDVTLATSGHWIEHPLPTSQGDSNTSPHSVLSRQASQIAGFVSQTQPQSPNVATVDSGADGISPTFIEAYTAQSPVLPPPGMHGYDFTNQCASFEQSPSSQSPPYRGQRLNMDSPMVTPLSSSSTWPRTDRSAAMLFSPVSPPSAVDGSHKDFPGTTRFPSTVSSPIRSYTLDSNTSTVISNSTAPSKLSVDQHISKLADQDQKLDAELEPEADFDSPSDFALFAEATNSLSFFPSESSVTSYAQPTPFPATSSAAAWNSFTASSVSHNSLYQNQTHLSLRSNPSVSSLSRPYQSRAIYTSSREPPSPERSRSVPPPNIHSTHIRSTSNPPLSIPPLPLHSAASVSCLRRGQSRSRQIAEELAIINTHDDHDIMTASNEELPDYETSQAEATERQRLDAISRARQLEQGWLRGRAERIKRPWRAWERGNGI